MRTECILEATAKQAEFIQAMLSGRFRYMCFGGAIRGGKTIVMFMALFLLCRMFKGSRWAVVRKDLPRIRRNTLPSFNRFKPDFVGDINMSSWSSMCANGSEIVFFPESIKEDPDLTRFTGSEFNGFLFEEANEVQERTFFKAIERAGTWKADCKRQPPPLILLTTNPAPCWVKGRFYDPYAAGILDAPYYYLPSRVTDNPHLEPAYLESLEELRRNAPEIYNRFVEGDWNTEDHPDQLIAYEWVLEALARELEPGKREIGLDVGGRKETGDKSVLITADGPVVRPVQEWPGVRTDQLADILEAMIKDNQHPVDADNVSIDTIGLGAGVWDNLKRERISCDEFVAGGNAVKLTREQEEIMTFSHFSNRRAQGWWWLRELFREGFIQLTEEHHGLIEDITAMRYDAEGSDKVIKMESKKSIKKRIGRSTDYGDALMMCKAPKPQGVDFVFC